MRGVERRRKSKHNKRQFHLRSISTVLPRYMRVIQSQGEKYEHKYTRKEMGLMASAQALLHTSPNIIKAQNKRHYSQVTRTLERLEECPFI